MIDLQAIEEREKAATPGPWAWHGWPAGDPIKKTFSQKDSGRKVFTAEMSNTDATFVVYARSDIPWPPQAGEGGGGGKMPIVIDHIMLIVDVGYWCNNADSEDVLLRTARVGVDGDTQRTVRMRLLLPGGNE